MAELKPCPFCGCTDIRVMKEGESITERHRAICFRCSAQIYRGTPKSAIEAWNRRASDGNEA